MTKAQFDTRLASLTYVLTKEDATALEDFIKDIKQDMAIANQLNSVIDYPAYVHNGILDAMDLIAKHEYQLAHRELVELQAMMGLENKPRHMVNVWPATVIFAFLLGVFVCKLLR